MICLMEWLLVVTSRGPPMYFCFKRESSFCFCATLILCRLWCEAVVSIVCDLYVYGIRLCCDYAYTAAVAWVSDIIESCIRNSQLFSCSCCSTDRDTGKGGTLLPRAIWGRVLDVS